jgi:iron complex transport system substrate-binding protein
VLLNGAPVDEIMKDPRIASLSAIKNKRVYALPEASWDFSSPRALFCIEWLAEKLYPERFADLDMDAEADSFYQAVFGVDYSGPELDPDGPAQASARTVIDMLGRKVAIPSDPQRLISLSPDLTFTALALGAGDRLVGVDTMSPGNANLARIYPELKKIPSICSFFNANEEALLAADPDVILTVAWQPNLDKLASTLGLPIVCVDPDYYREGIELVAQVLGREDRAEELLAYYKESQARIDGYVAARSAQPVKVYIAGGNGLMTTFGRESTWHFEIEDVGGVNVAADLQGGGSKEVAMEQVLLWDPDVVILDRSCPDSVADLLADARWAPVSAVKAKRVYLAPAGLVDTYGRPHLESALARVWLADKLYGEALGLDILEEARRFYRATYGLDLSDAEIAAALELS